MHTGPGRIVGAVFDEREIKGAETFADGLEACKVTTVTAKEDLRPWRCDDPGGPECAVAITQATSGEVLGRGGGQL